MLMRSSVDSANFSFRIIIITFLQLHTLLRSADMLLVVELLELPHAVSFDEFKREQNFDKLDSVQLLPVFTIR